MLSADARRDGRLLKRGATASRDGGRRRRSSSAALVAMVQPAHFRELDDAAFRRVLDPSWRRGVFVQRQVCSRSAIVRETSPEHAQQVSFAEDDEVVKTFATHRSDQAFDVWILPRTRRSRDDLCDAHAGDATLVYLTVDRIAVSHEPGRRGVFRKRRDDLLRGPFSGWMFSDGQVDDSTTSVREEDQHEQHVVRERGHGEEVH